MWRGSPVFRKRTLPETPADKDKEDTGSQGSVQLYLLETYSASNPRGKGGQRYKKHMELTENGKKRLAAEVLLEIRPGQVKAF